MSAVLERPGVTSRSFVDPKKGLGVSLFHSGAFWAPGESDEPGWLDDGKVVVGLAGSLRVDLANGGGLATDGWQPRLVETEYLAGRADFPNSLDGGFSFFLWDKTDSVLTLATDVAGSHQLYFYSEADSGYFAFATELKALLKLARVPREIDQEALAFFLRLGYVGAPLTILKRVSKALPFERLRVDARGTIERSRYYSLPASAKPGTGAIEEWLRPIHDEVVRGVERVSRGTAEVGLLLSGGIDSTVILAALKELGASRISAITLEFDGATNDQEVRLAADSARLVGANHTVVRARPDQVTPELLSTILREFDEPAEGFSRGPAEYLLSQAVRELGISSCLSGLHGETTICDFAWLLYLERLDKYGETKPKEDLVERIFAELTMFFSDQAQRELMVEEIDGRDVIRRIIRGFRVGVEAESDFQNFINIDGISDRSGRISIPGQVIPRLSGVEERAGFADRELIEFGQTVPVVLRGSERRERSGRTLLRLVFEDSMPTLANEAVKAPMPGLPWKSQAWLVNLVLRQAERAGRGGLLRERSVEKIIRKYRSRASHRDFANVWHLFVLQTWIDFNLEGVDPFEGVSAGTALAGDTEISVEFR